MPELENNYTVVEVIDEFHIHRVPEPRNSAEHKITDLPPVDFPRNHPATRELRGDEVDG